VELLGRDELAPVDGLAGPVSEFYEMRVVGQYIVFQFILIHINR
jgi:hypothetical protein